MKLAKGLLAACCLAASAFAHAGDGETEIRGVFLRLGNNLAADWIPAGVPTNGLDAALPDLKLRCRDDVWRKVTDHAARRGLNMVVVALDEGLVFPSHLELGVEGSWSAEKMRREVARLKSIGLEPIPRSISPPHTTPGSRTTASC